MKKQRKTNDAMLLAFLTGSTTEREDGLPNLPEDPVADAHRARWDRVLSSLESFRADSKAQSERALACALQHSKPMAREASHRTGRIQVLRWVSACAASVLLILLGVLLNVDREPVRSGSVLYIDFAAKEAGTGTLDDPYPRLSTALGAMSEHVATVRMMRGSSPEKGLRIDGEVRLEAVDGRVYLGKGEISGEKR